MVIAPFEVSRLPAIAFGEGQLSRVPGILSGYGRRVLVVRGARSLYRSPHWGRLADGLAAQGIAWEELAVEGEPSPGLVDGAVARFRPSHPEAVLGIGGGSVLDAAKAIAGLLPGGCSVMDHLEGAGRGVPYTGPSLPFVAVPTTAGTGTEATKNSVLSVRGERGFKRSFRHDELVARWAVVDPLLLESCPKSLIAADGMDALTQLLEGYVSSRANPVTDALAESGLAAVRDGLLPWHEDSGDPREARSQMAYAALLSGVVLAQAGLGSVHGVASPLGALFPVPHGVVCGTLVAAAVEVNVEAMRSRDPRNPALGKYARARAILSGPASSAKDGAEALVELLAGWTERLALPRLGDFGVREAGLPRIVADSRGGSMKTNPIALSDDEVAEVVRRRL